MHGTDIDQVVKSLGYDSLHSFAALHNAGSGGGLTSQQLKWLAFHSLRFCGRHVHTPAIRLWKSKLLTYRLQLNLYRYSITEEAAEQAFVEATTVWSDLLRMKFEKAGRRIQADIVVTSEGRSGQGCFYQLPGESDTVALILDDTLIYSCDGRGVTRFYLRDVFVHLIGHALGLLHVKPPSVMSAIYDPSVTEPTEADIRYLGSLYPESGIVNRIFKRAATAQELVSASIEGQVAKSASSDEEDTVTIRIPKRWLVCDE